MNSWHHDDEDSDLSDFDESKVAVNAFDESRPVVNVLSATGALVVKVLISSKSENIPYFFWIESSI